MEARNEHRSLEIAVKLFAAYHDGYIELKYSRVQKYSLSCGEQSGSGDWLYDEIRLSESGHVVHEIEWSSGCRWLIECAEVTYEWTQLETVTEAGT